ncbi:MAG: UDP-N-acetylmuramate--L-alanine ligase [bacterium]
MDYTKIKKVYIIGIEGGGTSSLACLYKNMGLAVSGSDEGDHFFADVLKTANIPVFDKFSATNLPSDADLIVYSSAYHQGSNAEMTAALASGKTILSYAETIADLFKQKFGIAVCGSHGKTTTTAWLGYVLHQAGLEPSMIVGAKVLQLPAGLIGQSDYLIVEADEYQNKLRLYEPKITLLNNIDYDHPDYFLTREDYEQAFVDFLKKMPAEGVLIANNDDEAIKRLVPHNFVGRLITYSLTDDTTDYLATDIRLDNVTQHFKVSQAGKLLGECTIGLLGQHNVSNALAVIAVCLHLGLDWNTITQHLAAFLGTARRLQALGEFNGVVVLDDFGHHPTEIKATISAVRQLYPEKRLVVVFHPHTFSRTKALFNDFLTCFTNVDELIILDIYASARETANIISSAELVEKIKEQDSRIDVKYIPTLAGAEDYLRNNLKPDQVLLLLGAGNIFEIGYHLTNYDHRTKDTK